MTENLFALPYCKKHKTEILAIRDEFKNRHFRNKTVFLSEEPQDINAFKRERDYPKPLTCSHFGCKKEVVEIVMFSMSKEELKEIDARLDIRIKEKVRFD